MKFGINTLTISDNIINIKIENHEDRSKYIYIGALFLFFIGIFEIFSSNFEDKKQSISELIISQSVITGTIVRFLIIFPSSVIVFFIYSEIIIYYLKSKFSILPLELYLVINYLLMFILLFSSTLYNNDLISSSLFFFASIWLFTNGYSLKHEQIQTSIHKNKIVYSAIYSKFLFKLSTYSVELAHSETNYQMFVRRKGKSKLSKNPHKRFVELGGIIWNFSKEEFSEETKNPEMSLVNYNCYLYFETIMVDEIDISHVVVPIGSFKNPKIIPDFIDLLSKYIKLEYMLPPVYSS